MRTKTKIIIMLFVVLYIGLIVVTRLTGRDGSDTIENANKMLKIEQEQLRERKEAAEGNVVYEENSQTASDEKEQLVAEYIEKNKDLFENKEHLFGTEDDVDLTIDLKMFKQGEEFRFYEMFWDITAEQVENILSYSLLEKTSVAHMSRDYTYYISEEKHHLYGETANAIFAFAEEQLKYVQMDFDSAKKPKALFASIVEALIDIYGEEYKEFEQDATSNSGYKWEAKNTVLQISTDGSCVTISVGITDAVGSIY